MKKLIRKFLKRFRTRRQQREKNQRGSLANRARKLNAPVINYFTRREIAKRDGWKCYLCGLVLTYSTSTLDHVLPLTRGGSHSLENAKLACDGCNSKKGNRTPEEYLNDLCERLMNENQSNEGVSADSALLEIEIK